MSTAVVPPTVAPLPPMVDRAPSPKSYPPLAPLSTAVPSSSSPATGHSRSAMTSTHNDTSEKTTPDGKRSPNTSRSAGPKISVKREPPSSPSLQAGTRHRPRKLDLSTAGTSSSNSSHTRGSLTAREGNPSLHDVGLACLSPGFQTQDPAMREQLQRSVAVRDQQRSIIEARLQKSAKGDGPDGTKPSESNLTVPKSATKKRPPPGLSIVPPSASQFANERVIQSAPLNQTFTGRRPTQPVTRHFPGNPSDLLSASPHIHHGPANQTNNRLPPISDVFGSDALAPRNRDDRMRHLGGPPSASHHNHSNYGPLPSPGLPTNLTNGQPSSKRPREYRSAEEAVHEMVGGREDLLPRLVHYSGNHSSQQQHQPASPPSSAGNHHAGSTASSSGPNGVHHHQQSHPTLPHPTPGTARRRTRTEYEHDNGSPPLGVGPETQYRRIPASATFGPFGAGRDSPDTQRRKKDEFLGLCARAWDLFHS